MFWTETLLYVMYMVCGDSDGLLVLLMRSWLGCLVAERLLWVCWVVPPGSGLKHCVMLDTVIVGDLMA